MTVKRALLTAIGATSVAAKGQMFFGVPGASVSPLIICQVCRRSRHGPLSTQAIPVTTLRLKEKAMTTLQVAAQKQLRQLVEQVERLEEEKKAIAEDIRDKLAEAKSMGFDVKAIRQIIRLRKKSKEERQEEEGVLEVYMHALGMLDHEPQVEGVHGLVAAE